LLLSRLDTSESNACGFREPSEEVRLLLLKIQAKVFQKCVLNDQDEVDHLRHHVDDILKILKSTILVSETMKYLCSDFCISSLISKFMDRIAFRML